MVKYTGSQLFRVMAYPLSGVFILYDLTDGLLSHGLVELNLHATEHICSMDVIRA